MKTFMSENIIVSEIDFCMYVKPNTGVSMIKNRRAHGLIYNCGETKRYIFSDRTKMIAHADDVVFIPKYSTYCKETIQSGNSYVINFDTVGDYLLRPFLISSKNSSEILQHFDNAENMWRVKSPAFYEKCLSEIYSIIYNIKKETLAEYITKTTQKLIKPALSYIHENFMNENISIEKLASLCGISEQYLRRVFTTTYGVSPLKYINNLKMLRARKLIKSGKYSMREVAELSGFFEYSYFSREFKKAAGVSPIEYSGRKNMPDGR